MTETEIQAFRKNLPVWTSFVSKKNLNYFKEHNILPIFIARTITNSDLIGKWQGTPVHFSELAPSPKLLRDWKTFDKIQKPEFEKRFLRELSGVNPWKIFRRLDILCHLGKADGIVLLGYGFDPENDHRSVVAKYLNSSYLIDTPITEYVFEYN